MANRRSTTKAKAKKKTRVSAKAKATKSQPIKARDTGFLCTMETKAKEIKARLEKATKAESNADDHRLAAALVISEVEQAFIKHKPKGTNFKKWCVDKNIVTDDYGRSWENIRKLTVVGQAKNPVKALADMRSGNATANRKLRKKKKITTEATSTDTAPVTFSEAFATAIEIGTEDDIVDAIAEQATVHGLEIVVPDETPKADEGFVEDEATVIDISKSFDTALSAIRIVSDVDELAALAKVLADRIEEIEQANAESPTSDEGHVSEDGLDIPNFMDQRDNA